MRDTFYMHRILKKLTHPENLEGDFLSYMGLNFPNYEYIED